MKNFLKQFINFIQKSYPKPASLILLLLLLISVFIPFLTTYNQKVNIEQKYSQREAIVVAEYNKQIENYNQDLMYYNSVKDLPPSEYFKKTGKIKNMFSDVVDSPMVPLPLDIQKSQDSQLNEFRRILNISFFPLYSENIEKNNIIFYIAILSILALPLLRILTLITLYGKKQIAIISQMTTFQKYLIVLIFCTLILLSSILIKVF